MEILPIKKAVANYCKSCIYDALSGGTWREQVEACSITQCDLYQHRPITAKTAQKRRQEYLDSLAPEKREAVEIRREISAKNMLKTRNLIESTSSIN